MQIERTFLLRSDILEELLLQGKAPDAINLSTQFCHTLFRRIGKTPGRAEAPDTHGRFPAEVVESEGDYPGKEAVRISGRTGTFGGLADAVPPTLTRWIDRALVGNRELKILYEDIQIAYYLFGKIVGGRKLLKDETDEPLREIVEREA